MTPPLPIVLVGTTLTRASDVVVRTAAEVARRLGATLHVAHAYPPQTWLGESSDDTAALEGPDRRATLGAEIDGQLSRLGIAPTEVGGRHLEPSPAHRWLTRLAADLAPELVVLGAGERERVRRFGLGSTARRLLGSVTRPVLVVRQPPLLPPTRVMAAVDLSPLSGDALRGGLELAARLWQDAPTPRVEVVFVLHPSEREGSRQFSEDQVDRFAAGELERFVRRNAPAVAGGARRRVLVGGARQRLAEEMDGLHPDLVILGTHGRSGFERFLVGSVATDLVARAPRAALVVPPAAAAAAAAAADDEVAQRSGDWSYVSDSHVRVGT